MKIIFVQFFCVLYSCHLFLISSASVRSIQFLPFIEPIFAWKVPLESLIFLKRSHSCHLLFDLFQFALIHGPNIPCSYAILLFTASDLVSITYHIHSWVLFLLWLHPFILSRVTFPLISGSILGTYWPGEFIFQSFFLFTLFMGFSLYFVLIGLLSSDKL